MDSIYIGFDGGGSQSRFLIKRGLEEPEIFAFDLNLKYSDIGTAKSTIGFADCLREVIGASATDISAICISLSGASDPSANNEFAQELRSELKLPNVKLHIESDSSFTLETAYPQDRSGILLISGTGSVAIAKKKGGEIVKVGGWGRMLGDQGSGYWIGMQALKHFCRAIDGIEEKGDLFVRLGEKLNNEIGSDLSLLRTKLYGNEIKPQDYAPYVFDALPNDTNAENILLEAAAELTVLIQSLWEKISGDCDRSVTLHGGIARQPFIGSTINSNCDSPGFKFEILDENAPLKRALEVSLNMNSIR